MYKTHDELNMLLIDNEFKIQQAENYEKASELSQKSSLNKSKEI